MSISLNAARANNLVIPAICYLTRCSPTLACRICLLRQMESRFTHVMLRLKMGWRLELILQYPKERRAIMEVYDGKSPSTLGL